MSHGQVTIDGHVMRPEFDRRWAPHQLQGRLAVLAGHTATLIAPGRVIY